MNGGGGFQAHRVADFPDGRQVWLLPENDDYSPIDGTYAKILGKVAAVVRHY